MGSKTHSSFQDCIATMPLSGAKAVGQQGAQQQHTESGAQEHYKIPTAAEKNTANYSKEQVMQLLFSFYLFGKQEGFLSVRPFACLDSTDCSKFDGDLATLENVSQYTSI